MRFDGRLHRLVPCVMMRVARPPMMLGVAVRVVFAVPTYNEAENIRTLFERMSALEDDVHVVFVDDASPDGTGDIADDLAAESERVHVIHRAGPRGYSAASKEGLRWGIDHGFDLVGTMDADLSHDPAAIPTLIAAIDAGADAAIGSRYVDGGRLEAEWGAFRRAVSRSGSRYARVMTGADVNDCTSGFRLYRASCLAAIPFEAIQSQGYSFLIELLAALARRNAAITEVPITYVDRTAGASKISKHIIVEALLRTTGLGLARLVRRAPGSVSVL